MSGFDGAAKAARDAAFAQFGTPVVVDPDGAALLALALLRSASVTEQMGPIEVVQHGRYMLFRAEDAPQPGGIVAILDAPDGSEIERRRIQGAPVFADRRRLRVEVDTAPV